MKVWYCDLISGRLILTVLAAFIAQSAGQTYPDKIGGYIGTYHPFDGHVYAGENVPESTSLHDAFNFGYYGRITHGQYGYEFPTFIHMSCEVWNINLMHAICRPPSESGVINAPTDTSIFNPTVWPPGMIQGAHRFSELAKLYPQIDGMIIDDFYHNYPTSITPGQLLDIRDALLGKHVDSTGTVHHDTPATTPHLKLFICMYEREMTQHPDSVLLNRIDGVNFWIWYQNSRYTNFNTYLDSVSAKFPGKDVIPGIYINNGTVMTTTSINYMLEHAIDLYDEGNIRGILMFSGFWLVMEYITRPWWDSLAMPHEFNQVYYPYLGRGTSRVIEESTGLPIQNAWITCNTYGRLTGDTFYVSRQRSDSNGYFTFGAWAGNRITDSTRYWLIAEKQNYISDTVRGWIGRQRTTRFPDLVLRSAVGIDEGSQHRGSQLGIECAPDPGRNEFRIDYTLPFRADASLIVYDAFGRVIRDLQVTRACPAGTHRIVWNGRDQRDRPVPAGIYFCRLEAGSTTQTLKIVLVR